MVWRFVGSKRWAERSSRCTRLVCGSVLGLNFPAERMKNYFAVLHNNGVGYRFVNVVYCLSAPENVGKVSATLASDE